MNRTFTQRPSRLDVAKGYDSVGIETSSSIFEPRGGAGMYSTVDDLLKYAAGHLKSGKFMKRETLDQLHRPNPKQVSQYYANGWGYLPTSEASFSLLSNGAIAGTATTVLVIPSENMAIVCLTNTTVGNQVTDGVAFDIAGALIPVTPNRSGPFGKDEPMFKANPLFRMNHLSASGMAI